MGKNEGRCTHLDLVGSNQHAVLWLAVEVALAFHPAAVEQPKWAGFQRLPISQGKKGGFNLFQSNKQERGGELVDASIDIN